MSDISSIRKDYTKFSLDEGQIKASPFDQFAAWWKDVLDAQVEEPNVMILSTIGSDNFPESRVVLLKHFSADGFTFFTNYESSKAKQIADQNKASIVFFWQALERQVRILGNVEKTSEAESDDYFQARPFASRIGAVASKQSAVIAGRNVLEEEYAKLFQKYDGKEDALKRPYYWGGYVLKPISFEFWQGRSSRLHDRIQYTIQKGGDWTTHRLSP